MKTWNTSIKVICGILHLVTEIYLSCGFIQFMHKYMEAVRTTEHIVSGEVLFVMLCDIWINIKPDLD